MKWKTISIPENIYRQIQKIARFKKIAMWKVLVEMISAYQAARRDFKKRSITDKTIWYITKLTLSVGEFRGNPNDKNKRLLKKTIEQVEQRLGVDLSELKSVIRTYKGDNASRKALNDTVKLSIMRILDLE